MSIFIGVGDIHFQIQYAHRKDHVIKTFENKFKQIFKIAQEKHADAILLTGDMFNSKNPQTVSHGLVSFIANLFAKSPCPIYSIVGNHDIMHNDLSRLNSQPLGVLFNSGALKRLVMEQVESTHLNGIDFGDEMKAPDYILEGTEHDIIISHAHMSKDGGMFYEEVAYSMTQLAEQEQGNDGVRFWLNGHDHTPYPIEKIKNTVFLRPGGLFRTTRGKEDLEREIKIVLIDTSKGEAKYIPLKHQHSENIFDLSAHKIFSAENSAICQFVGNLRAAGGSAKKRSVTEELEIMDLPPDVRESMLQYLAKVQENEG